VKPLLTLLFSILCLGLHAQSPSDWWYFGAEAGVHFTTTGPVAVLDGVMTTQEGCASVSSSDGDLLFYTDGTDVWDATHTVMPNGDSLLGNLSSTQSSVIVPYPGSSSKYAIVTVRGCTGGSTTGQSGYYFAYSVVDMTLNSGLGDVILAQKNIILMDSVSEKCTVVSHANGSDLWLIGRMQDSARYHAFRLTSTGVTQEVISNISVPGLCVGYMLANHSGDRLVDATYGAANPNLVFHFDQGSGVLYDPDSIYVSTGGTYGVHFSPNDELVYLSGSAGINQYDLTAANIQASEYTVFQGQTWALAEGPDEKIYAARYQTPYLARINDPDVVGVGCNFQDSAVSLDGRICWIGLPNHVGAGVFNIGVVLASNFCFGDSTYFTLDTVGLDSIVWNFGDPGSGVLNTSALFFPAHFYGDTGSYTITVIAYRDTLIDTAQTNIFIYPRQSLDLGPDSLLCFGDTVHLNIDQPYASFIWSDSSTLPMYVITDDETVWATVLGICDTISDTVQFQFDDSIQFELGPDTTFCEGQSLLLDANIQVEATYGWNTGDSSDAIVVSQTGLYELIAFNGCGEVSDSIAIEVIPNPDSALLPPDTLNCFDAPIFLTRPENDTITWLWSDSTDVKVFEVDTTMTIWLAAFNECGFLVDTFTAVFNGEIQTELREDTVICDEDSIRLFGTDSLATYLWNTGDTADTIIVPAGESKNYIVTITLRDCRAIESKEVVASDTACPDIDCDLRYGNVFTPNGDGWNDRFRIDSDCDIFKFSMSIYNRWGQLVHESSNVAYGWDGYVNGEPASPGTYFFTVEYKDFVVVNADRFVTQGTFSLLR